MSPTSTVDGIIILLYGLVAFYTISWVWGWRKETIPALIESSNFVSSYAAAYQFLNNATEIVLRGYILNRNGVFRIPRPYRWDYVANGAKRIAEVAAAPENILSFAEGVNETLQVTYMMGAEIKEDPWHHHTVQTTLTRNLGRCFPDVRDEIVCAFDDVLSLENQDWKSFVVLPNIMRVVAQTTNRLFVGLPLCRNQDYLNICIAYPGAVFKRCQIVGLFPKWLRLVVGRLLSTKNTANRQVLEFLGPLIRERLAKEDELGPDWPDKPNDLISWLMQDATPTDRTVSGIALRVLVVNMAAIHTSTMAFANALFDLVTYPDHIEPMREEVQRVINQDGWTKTALSNMHRVDSFLRESQRLNGSSSLTMNRKVVAKNDFTFSDGTVIPYGSFLSVTGLAVQHDPANYDHPEIFDGFRFSRMRDEGDRQATQGIFKSHMVSTAPEHLAFGHGKHACPGRFFAATELKAMLAHVLLAYDVKADGGVRPLDYSFGRTRSPNPVAQIWIRKRQ
ncbi:cytochrome P450 [Mycena capillaripes]|nr:cytochrome P450 [Mycena capillaripes]